MNTMNRTDLIKEVARESAASQGLVNDIALRILDTIASWLAEGREVRLAQFGIFKSTERKAMEGHNPRTGARIQIAAQRTPRFKPAKALRERMNPPQPAERLRRRA